VRVRVSSVEGIACDRVTDGGEVHANLVCAAGADADLEQSEVREAFEDAPGGEGGASVSEFRGHAGPAHWVTRDGAGDLTDVLLDGALDEGEVSLLDFSVGELRGEMAVGCVGAGDQENAAGAFVDSMDDAGAQVAADFRE